MTIPILQIRHRKPERSSNLLRVTQEVAEPRCEASLYEEEGHSKSMNVMQWEVQATFKD